MVPSRYSIRALCKGQIEVSRTVVWLQSKHVLCHEPLFYAILRSFIIRCLVPTHFTDPYCSHFFQSLALASKSSRFPDNFSIFSCILPRVSPDGLTSKYSLYAIFQCRPSCSSIYISHLEEVNIGYRSLSRKLVDLLKFIPYFHGSNASPNEQFGAFGYACTVTRTQSDVIPSSPAITHCWRLYTSTNIA